MIALALIVHFEDTTSNKTSKTIKFTRRFLSLLDDKTYLNHYFYQLLFRSLSEGIRKDTLNMCYSIFLCLLCKSGFDFSQIKHSIAPIKDKGTCPFDEISSDQSKKYLRKVYYETYSTIVDKLLIKDPHMNNILNRFEKCLENPDNINDIIDDEIIKEQINYDGIKEQYIRKIQTHRNIANHIIMEDRHIDKEQAYIDLLYCNKEYKLNGLDKCHIYDVFLIKKDLLNDLNNGVPPKELEKYVKFVEDPKNILLLPKEIHHYWDNYDLFDFDKNTGKLIIIDNSDIKTIKNLFGDNYKDICIKTPPFGDKMKFYFSRK